MFIIVKLLLLPSAILCLDVRMRAELFNAMATTHANGLPSCYIVYTAVPSQVDSYLHV